ncbi:MAG: MFS transporter [Verrucomicrobiae bacterium]|nr:MFS transporter [Verrucomicrobiae bacterium]
MPRENPWLSLLLNIAVPVAVLNKLSGPERLGPSGALALALVFPLGYGIWDRVRRRQWNLFSMIGLASILLTGGIGLLRLDRMWFAIKEAAIPLVLGAAVVGSLGTRRPLVRTLLLNPSVIDMGAVERALEDRGARDDFEALLVRGSWMVAASFLMSACLNFGLALWVLRSEPGTAQFNQELGRMTALSLPVISLPCLVVTVLALWHMLRGLERVTGLGLDVILRGAREGGSGPGDARG